MPGSFELPQAARHLARTGRYAAIVCVGCVIKGETPHFDFVARAGRGRHPAGGADTGVPVDVRRHHRADRGAGLGARRGRRGQPRRGGGARPRWRWQRSSRAASTDVGMGQKRGTSVGRQREVALQFLYQLDLHGAGDPAPHEAEFWARHPVDPETRALRRRRSCAAPSSTRARSISSSRSTPSTGISSAWRWWTATSCALAVYELLWQPDVPPKVAINEAIEIAKKFGTAESSRFINGVLDRILRELRRPPPEPAAPCGTRSCPTSTATSRRCARSSPTPRTRPTPCCAWAIPSATAPIPLACVELMAERAEAIVAGNHEHAVAGRLRPRAGSTATRARRAEWTRERLDDDHRGYLGALPLVA